MIEGTVNADYEVVVALFVGREEPIQMASLVPLKDHLPNRWVENRPSR